MIYSIEFDDVLKITTYFCTHILMSFYHMMIILPSFQGTGNDT